VTLSEKLRAGDMVQVVEHFSSKPSKKALSSKPSTVKKPKILKKLKANRTHDPISELNRPQKNCMWPINT
jgi:(p)ppGpp synthase/HD superfamily hydrolase